jgi:hypothetical protein
MGDRWRGTGEDVSKRQGGTERGMQQSGSVQSRQELEMAASPPPPSLDAGARAADKLQVSDGTAPPYRRHPHGLAGTDEKHALQQ